MSERQQSGHAAMGFVLMVGGVWVFSQVVIGGLVDRLRSYSSDEEPKGAGPRGSAFLPGAAVAGYQGERLLDVLKRWLGEDYQWGGESRKTGFDCSGFIHAGMGKLGFPNFPRTSTTIIAHCKRISVARALKTPGAVLWHPGHIAVSLGDNKHSREARGEAYGVGDFDARGRFQRGGLIPELIGPRAPLPDRRDVPQHTGVPH